MLPRLLYVLISTTALALAAERIVSAAHPQAVAALLVEDGAGVDATIRDAMEAERRACRTIAGDRPWTACEAR